MDASTQPPNIAAETIAAPSAALDDDRSFSTASTASSTPAVTEVGAGSFLLGGPAESGIVGASAYLFTRISENLALRPSIAAGTTPAAAARSTWAAVRLDACTRLPGNYTIRQGLQLDACGGVDGGFTHLGSGTSAGEPVAGTTVPYVDLGPSVALRGELGDRSAVWLRGLAGVNVVRAAFTDATGARNTTPLGSFRIELGFAWDR